MVKRMLIMLVVVGLVLGGVFAYMDFNARMTKQFMTAQGEPPQTVSTLLAASEAWLPELQAVGNLRASQGVELSSEVAGIITHIYFQQGDAVKSGAPLLELRADEDKAKLAALTAAEAIAHSTYLRNLAQFNANAVSKQSLDNDKANLEVAKANVAAQRALIDKKIIRAPFDGQLGLRAVDVGQFLNPGAAIATLQNLDTVYVDFFLPQQDLAVLKIGQKVSIKADAFPKQDFSGTVSVISPKVDVATRNVLVRATLKNPGHKLLPGMYVSTHIVTGAAEHFVTLPRSAISFNPFGATVFIVEKDGKVQDKLIAKQTFVTTGETRGDQVAILAGVKEGDTVVTSGQIKLRHGSTVIINNSVQPSNDPAPKPIDQ